MPVCNAWMFVSGIFIQDLKLNKIVGIIKRRKEEEEEEEEETGIFLS